MAEKKGLGSLEYHAIWTFLLVLYPKIPAASPADAKTGMIPVLRGTPCTSRIRAINPHTSVGETSLGETRNGGYVKTRSGGDGCGKTRDGGCVKTRDGGGYWRVPRLVCLFVAFLVERC